MGEISYTDANKARMNFRNTLEDMIGKLNQHFYDMDFENADKREEMEEKVEDIIRICRMMIEILDSLTFE